MTLLLLSFRLQVTVAGILQQPRHVLDSKNPHSQSRPCSNTERCCGVACFAVKKIPGVWLCMQVLRSGGADFASMQAKDDHTITLHHIILN